MRKKFFGLLVAIFLAGTALPCLAQLIQPNDLVYMGAFRLPDWPDGEIGWAWSGAAMAYYPDGDPNGPADGYPGSIFGTGHDWNRPGNWY